MRREPSHLARCDYIVSDDGRPLGTIYYDGIEEMRRFREWFDSIEDELKNGAPGG